MTRPATAPPREVLRCQRCSIAQPSPQSGSSSANKWHGEVQVNIAPRQNSVIVRCLKRTHPMGTFRIQRQDQHEPIHPMSADQTVRSRRRQDLTQQSTHADWADGFGAWRWSASPEESLGTPQSLDSHRSTLQDLNTRQTTGPRRPLITQLGQKHQHPHLHEQPPTSTSGGQGTAELKMRRDNTHITIRQFHQSLGIPGAQPKGLIPLNHPAAKNRHPNWNCCSTTRKIRFCEPWECITQVKTVSKSNVGNNQIRLPTPRPLIAYRHEKPLALQHGLIKTTQGKDAKIRCRLNGGFL